MSAHTRAHIYAYTLQQDCISTYIARQYDNLAAGGKHLERDSLAQCSYHGAPSSSGRTYVERVCNVIVGVAIDKVSHEARSDNEAAQR